MRGKGHRQDKGTSQRPHEEFRKGEKGLEINKIPKIFKSIERIIQLGEHLRLN